MLSTHERQALWAIAAAVFEWRADMVHGIVRVTAYGATAGFGETEAIAKHKAIGATLRDLTDGLDVDEARLSICRAVWEHGRGIDPSLA